MRCRVGSPRQSVFRGDETWGAALLEKKMRTVSSQEGGRGGGPGGRKGPLKT